MTVTLNLKPEVEARVAQKAAAEGTNISEFLEKIAEQIAAVEPAVSPPQTQAEKNQAALAVLRQWDEEDASDDPEEIARRQAELDAFKAALNESHTSNRVIYP